jgi:hypothetical protein
MTVGALVVDSREAVLKESGDVILSNTAAIASKGQLDCSKGQASSAASQFYSLAV